MIQTRTNIYYQCQISTLNSSALFISFAILKPSFIRAKMYEQEWLHCIRICVSFRHSFDWGVRSWTIKSNSIAMRVAFSSMSNGKFGLFGSHQLNASLSFSVYIFAVHLALSHKQSNEASTHCKIDNIDFWTNFFVHIFIYE